MKTQSNETHPEAEKVFISLMRNASTARKLSQVRSLSMTTLQLSRRAIACANRGLTERQIDVLFVSHHYGKELADKLDTYLDTIAHENS